MYIIKFKKTRIYFLKYLIINKLINYIRVRGTYFCCIIMLFHVFLGR